MNIKGVLSDFNITARAILYCDNMSAIQISRNNENSKRTKHIDIKVHYLQDLVLKKVMDVEYVPTHKKYSRHVN